MSSQSLKELLSDVMDFCAAQSLTGPESGMSVDENAAGKKSILRLESFSFNSWRIETAKGHILNKDQEQEFSSVLSLPHLPDMVFAQNHLRLSHSEGGFGISLNPLDALRHVNDHQDLVHVALAKEWKEARKDSPHINKIIHPYDWTYTPTGYKGTLTSELEGGAKLTVTPTQEKIDYERLKVQEKILFYQDLILYEDELDDNGCTVLSTKIRVMPSGFFLLLRFYLRVDNTLIRVIDTRIHYLQGNNYLLREYTERESKISDLNVPPMVLRDQNEIVNHLKIGTTTMERLDFPTVVAAAEKT